LFVVVVVVVVKPSLVKLPNVATCLYAFTVDAPTEVQLGLFVIGFYSVSEQTMVSDQYLAYFYCTLRYDLLIIQAQDRILVSILR